MTKNNWTKIGLPVLLLLLYLLVTPLRNGINQAVLLISQIDIDAIKAYILSFGVWAPVISFLLMVLQSLAAPLPAFMLTFANAALFGWVKGALLSWSSAMAGAVLCYYIAKLYGRSAVEKLVNRFALAEADKFFSRYGKYAILIARLLPFISFDIVSYAAGLTSISFWEFFWATGLGQLPATVIYSYVGDMLVGSARTFVFGLLILFSMTVMIYAAKRFVKDKKFKLSA